MRNSLIKGSICLCAFLFSLSLTAQERTYVEPKGLSNWYIELGGAAFVYSLNYEQVLYRSAMVGWVGRIGASYSFADGWFLNKVYLDKGAVMAPFTTSVLIGSRERKEKLEVGAGVTLINKDVNNREIVPTAVFGFRVVETNKVCFRVSYTPFIRDGKYESWFGVSIGRNFSIGRSR
jgi:hypothetical protein